MQNIHCTFDYFFHKVNVHLKILGEKKMDADVWRFNMKFVKQKSLKYTFIFNLECFLVSICINMGLKKKQSQI